MRNYTPEKFTAAIDKFILQSKGELFIEGENTQEMLKDLSMVLGISRIDGHLVGDCENDVQCYFKSPVPGGVGLLTRLGLLKNFIDAQME